MFNLDAANGFRPRERRSVGPAARKAVEAAFANRPQMSDFINNPYTRAEVEADQARLKSREVLISKTPLSGAENEALELSRTFEASVLVGINNAGLLGKDGLAGKTLKYDDEINKVDMVVEFQSESSATQLGLATDVTFSSKPEVIAKKFNSIRDRIKRGVLAEVKYFQSPHTKSNHALTNMPEVVIGVSRRMVEELGRLLEIGDYTALAKHPSGIMILRQIELQLIKFESYAKSVNQPKVAGIYSQMLIQMQKILDEKAELVAKTESKPNTDPVHMEIMKFVETWSRY